MTLNGLWFKENMSLDPVHTGSGRRAEAAPVPLVRTFVFAVAGLKFPVFLPGTRADLARLKETGTILLKEFSKALGAAGVASGDNSWSSLERHLAWQRRRREETAFKRLRILIISK